MSLLDHRKGKSDLTIGGGGAGGGGGPDSTSTPVTTCPAAKTIGLDCSAQRYGSPDLIVGGGIYLGETVSPWPELTALSRRELEQVSF